MKIYNKLFIGASLCFAVSSCADQGLLPFPGELQVPDELLQNKNLQEYDVLKNYVNRSENPDFKLGCALDESDFIAKGTTYGVAVTNFEDVTPGNAMKYSSVVDDNGNMDFSTILSFIETAQNAGLSIYGHTLCWHSQQNVNYLNGLISGKKSLSVNSLSSRAGDSNKYCLKLTGSEGQQTQGYYTFSNPLPAGTYTLKCKLKSSVDISGGNLVFQPSSWTGDQTAVWEALTSTTEWTDFSIDITIAEASANVYTRFFFQFNANPEDYLLVDDISLTLSGDDTNYIANPDFETGNIDGWSSYNNNHLVYELTSEDGGNDGGGEIVYTELLENGDFENGELSACYLVQSGGTTYSFVDEGGDHGKVLAVTNPTVQANDYGSQFIFSMPYTAKPGDVYVFSVDVKSLVDAKITTQAQSAPGAYLHWNMFGDINTTTGWKTFSKEITVGSGAEGWEGLGAVALNLGLTATTYYFDNISFKKKEIKTEELTPEEKHDIVYAALDTWIKNMMEICAGNVKVWDVVNEPMSDGNPYELKHYDTESADTRDNCFYWQDYLGDNYARDAVALARKYFEEFGGNPSDLKLFVNDYNLEASYNNNAKCEGLIKMIQQWESDGVTKIDGIGTQMHVSCSLNPDTQQKNEDAVVNMFNLLAQTGKQIKISELDMGLTDENGDNVLTTDVTYVQLLHMADYYNFIVRKYFELIPQNQRYGITQWSQTDAGDEDYAWRKGMPIGLWTRSYDRKPAYAGFADGLAGTEKSYLGWATEDGTDNGNENSDVVE